MSDKNKNILHYFLIVFYVIVLNAIDWWLGFESTVFCGMALILANQIKNEINE